MASTPPHQLTFTPDTPSTPLHGPLYDDDSPRTRSSARLRQKRGHDYLQTDISERTATRTQRTPRSPRTSYLRADADPYSPQPTPKRKSVPRVQIHSPTSPTSDFPSRHPLDHQSTTRELRLSSATTVAENMLPTPVKTPKKKKVPKSTLAGRALFQEPTTLEELAQSPHKARKSKRYNGFSLESFRVEEDNSQGPIQIFTDSRDQIPEADNDDANPFVQETRRGASSKKVPGTVKRRKVSEPRIKDQQVAEAIEKDEGMVYVFRGRKVYRRFDDSGEEEEVIDPDDLGLLEHAPTGSSRRKNFKTLTRKSIKPTRLFQSEEQKLARALEKDEEAATDIEEMVTEHDESTAQAISPVKKGSPFDSWPRLKPGATSTGSRPGRGRKRPMSEERRDLATMI